MDAGLLVGGYQWLYKASQVSPGGQAREFVAYLKDHPVHIRPAVDFEWSREGKQFNVGIDDLRGHVIPFTDGYGKKPMIYTAVGYWSEYGSLDPMWADYPSWQARYGDTALPMAPWPVWKFWQFTDNGEGARYGVPSDGEKDVDLNYWCGPLTDLCAWCGVDTSESIAPLIPHEETPVVVETPLDNQPVKAPVIEELNKQPLTDTQGQPHGVLTSYRKTISERTIIYYVAKLDLGHVKFMITPPTQQGIRPVTVTTFLQQHNLDLAINGDGFTYVRRGRGYIVKSAGFAAAGGVRYPNDQWIGNEQTLYISKDNKFSLAAPANAQSLWNAISFPNLLMQNGKAVLHPDRMDVAPRTVLGISADEQTAYFLLVDGNEAAGTGCTLDEAAEILMAEQPMEIIVNLDGGGSTTGVRKGPEGKPLLFNVPSDDNVSGIQRLVATQVGISFN